MFIPGVVVNSETDEQVQTNINNKAYDDLKKAYELAYAMVSKYGMSEKIGYVGYVETDYNKTYSDETNKVKNSLNLFR